MLPLNKESSFCLMFCELLCDAIDYGEARGISREVREILVTESKIDGKNFRQLSNLISTICKCNGKPMILIIDEVDQASNHKVFLDFFGSSEEFVPETKNPFDVPVRYFGGGVRH